MEMRMEVPVWLGVVAVLVAACGCLDTNADDYGLSRLDELRPTIRAAVCSRQVRCNQVEDMTTCLERELYVDTSFTLSERAAIEARRLRFDAPTAALCASEIAQLACDAPFVRYVVQGGDGLAAFCKSAALTGVQEVGQPCVASYECRNQACGALCEPGTCCTSVCEGVGEPTSSGFVPPPHDRPPGAVCSNDSDCALGLYCYYDTHVCTRFPSLDEQCTGACGDGLRCDPTSLRCVKLGLAGASCASQEDCSSMYPFCDRSGHCTGGRHAHEDCRDLSFCADDGTFCDLLDKSPTCVQAKPDGAACLDQGEECASGVCDQQTSRCVPEFICF
jgi:hypothetical protein